MDKADTKPNASKEIIESKILVLEKLISWLLSEQSRSVMVKKVAVSNRCLLASKLKNVTS